VERNLCVIKKTKWLLRCLQRISKKMQVRNLETITFLA
jgi:hypothetical protein